MSSSAPRQTFGSSSARCRVVAERSRWLSSSHHKRRLTDVLRRPGATPGRFRHKIQIFQETEEKQVRSDNGRVAIVTGAARGIGAAVATRLAEDGHAVAVLDMDAAAAADTAQQIIAAGGKACSVSADVCDEAAVDAAVSEVVAELGAPTILVNNAGVLRDNLLFKMSSDDWDTVMNVHLRGSFLMARAVQRHMVDQTWGRVVNISSTSALGNRGQANYAAAKAGLQGLTKTLSIELGRFGVTANAVAPGFIETDMTAATAARVGTPFDEYRARAAAIIPVGRTGLPADIAHAVSFFTSEGAGFVSGQVLYVAGGPRG